MSNAPAFAARGRLWPALALMLPLLAPQPASAQAAGQNSLFSAAPSTGLIAPAPATRGEPFGSGGVLAPQSEWPLTAPRADRAERGADGAGRAGGARALGALRQGRARRSTAA